MNRYELLKTYVNCTPNLRREDIPPADVEVGIQGGWALLLHLPCLAYLFRLAQQTSEA